MHRKTECVTEVKMSDGDGGDEREMLLPYGVADWTKAIAMRDVVANTGEVEAVGALGGEHGLALPCCKACRANPTCFVINGGTHGFLLV